jgi:hypothetical protein
MPKWSSSLVLALLLVPLPGSTQDLLTLAAGFTPDPRVMSIKAGGSVEVDISDECQFGYISEKGVMGIDYTAGVLGLYVYVEGEGDTMLLIQTPSGEIVCDDDSHTDLNPLIHIEDPESGLYIVFVGSYTQNEYHDATLYVSELGPGFGSSEGSPDLSLDPTYGRVSLSAPLSTDPHTVSISAGGSVDVDVGGCGYGFVATAPDYNLTYSGSGSALFFFVRSSEDTTLLINKPDGSWVCDDDSLGDSNPLVTIPNASSGLYNIWVGTYSDGDLASSTLYISTKGAK